MDQGDAAPLRQGDDNSNEGFAPYEQQDGRSYQPSMSPGQAIPTLGPMTPGPPTAAWTTGSL